MVQIAFDQGGSVFDGAMSDGGNLLMQCIALVEVIKLPDWDAAESLARSIALAGLAAMRGTDALRIGNDVIEQAVESDFGIALPVRFTVEQTYDTSDYTVA